MLTSHENHIAHHLLSLFALNATPAEIRQGWEDNVSYQRPPVSLKESIVTDMHDPKKYKTYLGSEKYYHDFLVFFQEEMDQKGWQEVLNEYVFKGDERANDMLVRMFSGILHPIIHLGFGIEFEQPAIIAEALAQAAVHSKWEASHLIESEKAAKAHSSDGRSDKSIVQLLGEIYAEKKSKTKYASQVHVTQENLEEKTAEMINAAGKLSSQKQATSRMLTPGSVLHRRRTEAAPPSQIRLLEHPRAKPQHLLLLVPPPAMALHTQQDPPPRMEDPRRPGHVRVATSAQAPP